MNAPQTGLRVASVIFALFCLGHIFRLVRHTQVLLAGHIVVPLWISVIAVIISGALSIWMWKLSSK